MITRTHLDALFNLGGILILDTTGTPLAVGRRLAAGERFLATADAAYALFRAVGTVEETAAALALALAGTSRGPLL
jgi:hypothetical protein